MAASASSAADPAAAAAIAFATALPSRLAPTPCTARLLSLFNNPALPPSALAPVSTVLLPTLVKGTSNAAAYATVLSKLASAGLPTPPMAQQPLLDKTGGGAALSSALAVLTEQATHEVGRKEKRAAHLAVAAAYCAQGEFSRALPFYPIAMDAAENARELVETAITGAEAACLAPAWPTVQSLLSRADVHVAGNDPNLRNRLAVVAGVLLLQAPSHGEGWAGEVAGKLLGGVNPLLPTVYGVAGVEDVAAYGILCAIAGWPRETLKRTLLDPATLSPQCRGLLDACPAGAAAVRAFLGARYARSTRWRPPSRGTR